MNFRCLRNLRLLFLQTLTLLLALAAGLEARAQSYVNELRWVTQIEADEAGPEGLAGLAFPPPRGPIVRLELAEGHGPSSIFLPESGGMLGLRLDVPDSINLGFAEGADGAIGLLLFDGTRHELTRVHVQSSGHADVRRFDADAWGVADAQGITIDPTTGRIFVLDAAGHRIVRVESDPTDALSRPDDSISEIPLPEGLTGLRGIAFDRRSGHLHVLSPGNQELYEFDAAGRFLALRRFSGLGALDPRALAFAFSTDQTDDPSATHLFVANTGPDGENSVTEWSLDATVANAPTMVQAEPVRRAKGLNPPNASVLIQDIDLSILVPPSPDASGVAYDGVADTLLITDSEVNETPLYTGFNVFEVNRVGTLVGTFDTTHFSAEPSGATINPANGHCFISEDTGSKSIYEIDPGADGDCLTGDDIITSFPSTDFGAIDPEGLAFGQGNLFVLDGSNREIYQIAPGLNGFFDGAPPTGDDQVTMCDTAHLGVNDPEGITYDDVTGHLYVVGQPEDVVAQITPACGVVRNIDISAANAVTPAGAALAPSTVTPGEVSLWISDRGVDNDPVPDENDGRLYELSLPYLTPGNTPPIVSAGADIALTFPDAAALPGLATDDGLPAPPDLITQWSVLSGQGLVTFGDDSQPVTNAMFSVPGSYVLRLTASDGELQQSDDVAITVNPPDGSTIFEKRIDVSEDDAEELEPGGNVDRLSSDLELVENDLLNQTVGLRFTGILVPAGATILDAYVQFTTDEANFDPAALTLTAEAADHAPPILNVAGDLTSRTPTAALAPWNPDPWPSAGQAGEAQRSPDLSAVLQEIVDRPGWVSGNAVLILVNGTGKRVAESVDGDFDAAPLLHVQYALGNPPVVTITSPTSGGSVDLGDPINFAGTAIDPEDGDLTAGLNWASDLDGTIGSGGSFSTSSLSAGVHTITATVADNGALPGSDQITFTVVGPNQPPAVTITSPLDGTGALVGDSVSFVGTAIDPEEGDLTAGLSWSSDVDGVIGSGAGFSTASLTLGLHTITASVTDGGGLPGSDQITFTISSTPIDVIVEKRIDVSTDDAEEDYEGELARRSPDLEFLFDGGDQHVGLRFTGLNLPQGAVIEEAYVQFQVDEADSVPTLVTIEGQAADSANPFVEVPFNISSRPRTAASVLWNPAPWLTVGEAGLDQRTSDLTPVVQEIVDRPGWSVGNPLVLLFSGIGARVAEAYDGLPAGAPLIHVRYRIGGDKAPAVNISSPPASSIVNEGDPVNFAGTASDDEDGDLTAGLSWVSDLDGSIGSGAGFSTSSLSVGLHTITASVTDTGGRTGSDQITIQVLDVLPDGSMIFEKRIESSWDDSEENASGQVNSANADLELVEDYGVPQTVGLRFTGIPVPTGATIVNAYIQFKADETGGNTSALTLEGEASDDAIHFLEEIGNISSRPRTSASVAWSPAPWTTVGATGLDQRTPDLTSIVQEIVDRPGWASGNALAFVATGSGRRAAESFEGDVAGAALLHLQFGVGLNTPPDVEITAPASSSAVAEGDPVGFTGTASDLQDGDLSASLSWVSDLDGAIGSGASFVTSTLSPGLHIITASVTDSGALPGSDQITLDVITAPTDVIVEKRIDDGIDDVEQKPSGGVSRLNADLEMVFDNGDQTVGLRFTGLAIPPGVAILESYIQFQADETGSTPTFLAIDAEATDDAVEFTSASGDVTSRPRTVAWAPWSPDPWLTIGEAGLDQRTSDLSAIVQEIVDRPGWSTGNALAFIVAGIGERVAEAYEGVPAAAPLLHVRYRVAGNKAPAVTITSPTSPTVDEGASVDFAATAPDAEDGDLSANLSWVSDLDGVIGSGAGFSTSSLSVGLHTITASVTDSGGRTGSYLISLEVLDALPDGTVIFEKRVEATWDDAEESSAGTVVAGNADLELVEDGGLPQVVGIRFTDIAVPPGATIVDAYVQFQADESHTDSTSITIEGEASNSAPVFLQNNGNISSRIRTLASVPWSPAPWPVVGEAGVDQRTSNISSIIQEIVNRPAWASGNDLALIFSGTGKRVAEAFDGDQAGAPLLHIRFGVGLNTPPVVSITAPVSGAAVAQGAPTDFVGTATDGEQGNLSASLTWVSDLDGTIGSGGSFSTSALSAGLHTITASVVDGGGLPGSDQITLDVIAAPTDVIVEKRIDQGFDDAEEKPGAVVSRLNSDLELVFDTDYQTVGVRFDGLAIPPGVAILEAYVQFQADETDFEATDLTIEGEAAGHAPGFLREVGNLSSRPRTTARAPWSPAPWQTVGEAGLDQRTPDLSAVIQEIVDRPDWVNGNALAFLITGTGKRVAESYDGNAPAAPLLHVRYRVGGNKVPAVSITTPIGGTVNEGEPVNFSGTANDAEDGVLTASLSWVSDLDGVIGSGIGFSTTTLSAGLHTITASVTDSGGRTGSDLIALNVDPSGVSPVLVGAGDIAECGDQDDEATADLLDAIPGTVFTTGDNVYEDGTEAEFNSCYDPSWGRHKGRTRPSVGNHEYATPGATPYFDYFGASAGDPSEGWYSYDVGDWHIVVLNSNCTEIGGCNAASAQGQWLQADLAANPNACTLAYWHHPRFSSSDGGDTDYQDFWQLLYDAGADVVLAGHSHHYERFAPQDATGLADPRGIRSFVVGTGGRQFGTLSTPRAANSEVSNNHTHGVLKLTLNATSYDWEFVPVAGSTFTDSGSASCVTDSPVVSIAAPVDGAAVEQGTSVDFAGAAGDFQEGDLSASLTWVSDLDGTIGSGGSFSTSALSAGLHTITASVIDGGGLPGSDQITLDVVAVPSDVIVEKRIDHSFDDAEEPPGGTVSRLNGDLELVLDTSNQTVGVRFDGLAIPPGVAILEAYVQFQADEKDSEPTYLTIEGEAVGDAPAFSPVVGSLSTRSRTMAWAPWIPAPWQTVGDAGLDQRTPDLSAIVQEIVDRPDWANGNALAFLITGVGKRVAESFDGNAPAAPLLHVRYRVGGNKVPAVSITNPIGGTVHEGDVVNFAGMASDGEDGDLTASLSWVSDLDGVIGSGSGFSTSTLSVGLHTITVSVTDSGGRTGSDLIVLDVLDVMPDGSVVFETSVETSFDDAEENSAGVVTSDNADLELVTDGGSPQTVGIRFTGVAVPAGSTVVDAYIQFQADETGSNTSNLTLEGEAVDHAETFVEFTAGISSRPRTGASVPWSAAPWLIVGEAGVDQQTPDLSAVIQEIVDRPGWASGNALSIIVTGSGRRVAEAFDGDVDGAPLLHVRFQPPAP
jgi:hypothetical protein